jgi:N-acyl-D-amino-acid deacylase
MYSLIIKNGMVVDGSGAKPYKADIAIEGNTIVQIGDLENSRAKEVVDAEGKYVSPGFVDIQNHSDVYWALFDNPGLDSMVAQGITTAMVGNCGASLAPLISKDSILSIRKWHDLNGLNYNWESFSEYLKALAKQPLGINVGSLVGYSTLRRGLLGDQLRALSSQEEQVLLDALNTALQEGAFGLSTGLGYAHETFVSESELKRAAQMVKKHDALLSIHLRSEGAEITEGLAEAVQLLYEIGVNMKISHMKVHSKSNWHLMPHVITQLEDAYHKKGNIHFDLYPYDITWNVLYTYLPKWAYEGGQVILLQNLKDQTKRRKILDYLVTQDVRYSELYITNTSINLNVSGKKLGEVAARHEVSSEEMLLDLLERGGTDIRVFERNINSTHVEELAYHPLSIIASDGVGLPLTHGSSLVHPRCFGAMPKFLGMALSSKRIGIEEAVAKITSTPASKAGIEKRGLLALGHYADIVIFSPNVNSKADEVNPFRLPEGIDYVFVNGECALREGKVVKSSSGSVLSKGR